MKNIFRFLAAAGLTASLAACNKAEFFEENFVSFESDRLTVLDDGEKLLRVPINLYGADECVITYTVSDDTAKEGDDFTVVDRNGNPDKTGVLNISNTDETADNAIYVKVKAKPVEEQGNLSFKLVIEETAEDGVVVGALNTCKCIIIDKDLGLPKLVGRYEGEGVDTENKPVTFTFNLAEYDASKDPEAKYPKANCMLTDGNIAPIGMNFAEPVYAYFDLNTSEIQVYGLQTFNTYNFQDIGEADVALGLYEQAEAKSEIVLAADAKKGTLELTDKIMVYVLDADANILGGVGDIKDGYVWTKK